MPARTSRILLFGYFDRGNLGDDAMHEGLRTFARSELPLTSVQSIPLPSLDRRSVRRLPALLRALRSADAVVLAGGSHFHDRYGRRSMRILISFLILFAAAKSAGARVGYAAIGFGPLESPASRRIARLLIRMADAVMVRDERSRDAVTGLDARARPLVGFDAAALLERPPPAERASNVLGVALLPYYSTYHGDPARDDVLADRIAQALAQAGRGSDLRVCVLVFSHHGWFTDHAISARLVAALDESVGTEVVVCTRPADVIERMSRMTGVVAMRYHAALLSYLTDTPLLIVDCDAKSRGLAQDAGYPEKAVLGMEEVLDPAVLSHRLSAMLTAGAEFAPAVRPNDASARAREGLRAFAEAIHAA